MSKMKKAVSALINDGPGPFYWDEIIVVAARFGVQAKDLKDAYETQCENDSFEAALAVAKEAMKEGAVIEIRTRDFEGNPCVETLDRVEGGPSVWRCMWPLAAEPCY